MRRRNGVRRQFVARLPPDASRKRLKCLQGLGLGSMTLLESVGSSTHTYHKHQSDIKLRYINSICNYTFELVPYIFAVVTKMRKKAIKNSETEKVVATSFLSAVLIVVFTLQDN